jgi:hypothetical protein
MRRRDEAHCSGTVCSDASSASTLQQAKTSADWSTALVVSGGILVAGGTTLWILTRDGRASVRVGAAPTAGGVLLTGSLETR